MIRALALASCLAVTGCARVHCAGKVGACTGHESLQYGGLERTFRIHLPSGYDGRAPLPLLLALHGRLGDGDGMEKLGRFEPVADREGFLVVYPDGVDKSWNDRRGATPASKQKIDDLGFLVALVDHVRGTWKVDPRRVYATGMSNGAFMTHELACERADRFAAVATVAGTLTREQLPTCAPSRPVPIVMFLGTKDELVPYQGGPMTRAAGGTGLSADETFAKWSELDGCVGDAVTASEPDLDAQDGTTTSRRAHSACRSGASVELYSIDGGGHTWPGGWQYLGAWLVGKSSRDISATELMWSFMKTRELPPDNP